MFTDVYLKFLLEDDYNHFSILLEETYTNVCKIGFIEGSEAYHINLRLTNSEELLEELEPFIIVPQIPKCIWFDTFPIEILPTLEVSVEEDTENA